MPQQATHDRSGPRRPEPLTAVSAERLADRFKLLADPTRLRLLSILATNDETCVCDLVGVLGVSQPTVSHHVKLLKDAGLVEGEARGSWTTGSPTPHTSCFLPACRACVARDHKLPAATQWTEPKSSRSPCGFSRVRRWALLLVVAALASAACTEERSSSAPAIDERPASQAQAIALTLEEAGFLAAGALVDIYDERADPVPVDVEDTGVRYRGQQMWRLDVTVQVTLEGKRTERLWRVWVGTRADGQAAVVRAEERQR